MARAVSGILVMVENLGLARAMASRLRREGYLVHYVRDLDPAAYVVPSGEVDFLFVELPEGGRSIEEVRSEIAILLPRWSIAIRDSSVRESGAAAGLLGNNTRRLLN